MPESSTAGEYFEHLPEYSLAVCKECRHGVLPSQAGNHLQRVHRVRRKQAQLVADELSSWPGLIQYASELEVPRQTIEPISQLPVYTDGLMCRLESDRCRQVLRSAEVMRKHWQKVHDWSAGEKRGRPSRTERKGIQSRSEQGYKAVHCQRLFVQGPGSQYIEVHQPDSTPEPIDGETGWARVGRNMDEAWANVQKRAEMTIQDGARDEVNPWLERTGWMPYLVGMERPELLASVEEPKGEEEPVAAAIWEAMDELARFSQVSVIHRTGIFVRLEAIRTEKHQTRFTPLQPYMDEKSIGDHARPWKQMLMFFWRTQQEHAWKSPKYQFTKRQREAWGALIKAAGGAIEEDEEAEEEEEEGQEESGEDSDEETTDDAGSVVGEMEEELAEGVGTIGEPGMLSSIQKACLAFCIALLSQSITRKEYDSPLVCALAVLGVKEDGWKGAEQYPPILSAVIKVARFMVVQQALALSEAEEFDIDADSGYESGGSTPQQRRPRGCLQHVQQMMDRFMVRGSHGPMQWMLDLRTYGLKIHYNTTSRGHVEWVGQDELLYKELQFTMAQFRSMVHGLVDASRRVLMEDLLFSNSPSAESVPSIPWESLRDNPTDERPGWNFLQDQRTHMPVDGERWLFEWVGQNARIRNQFMKPGTRSGVDQQEVKRYMDRVVAFREKLIVLIHIAGGQPARGPEIMSIRHSNTRKGGHRNIFIEDGQVVFVTRYHKGYAVSGDVKIIHRYLPREVGELVVYYMWLVLPFQQRMEAMVWEKEAISSHMWPADPSGRKWTTDRLREALKRETSIGLSQALTIAAYREIAIGISRRFLRGSTAFQPEEGDENEAWNEENMAGLVADLQAGHTAHVAGLIYARGIMEQAGAVADRRRQFRMSSTDWHRFLGFPPDVKDEEGCRKRKRAPFESEADEARIDRWGRLRKMDAAEQLRRMAGERATFRSVQKDAIEAVVGGESPVVAVMPTGAGKSMLFMLPAWAEQGGTTIVVVPLIALRGDMKRRCEKLGISCAAWDSRRPPDAAAVVLVTPESAVTEAFATFVNRLRATRQLDRIVIDECHVVLNQRYTFRKQMQQLGKLVAAETQMVLLTATLPPSEEDELFRRMHFDPDQVKVFRAETARTNVAYRVIKVGRAAKKQEVEEMVLGVVRQKLRRYKKGKVVIYGNSVRKVQALAQRLGCHAYYHDAVGKASMLEDFVSGRGRVIVATSALGMGVDIPDIRCIVHIDWPFSVLDYAQESGRAGRDGARSEAVMIVQEGAQRAAEGEREEREHGLVRALVGEGEAATCRRVVLGGYLDGREVERVGCEEGEEKCDMCRGAKEETDEEMEEESEAGSSDGGEMGAVETERERGAERERETEREEVQRAFRQQEQTRRGPRQRLMQVQQEAYASMEWLRRQLARWANRCGICEAAGSGQSAHDVRRCWRAESQQVKEMVEKVEQEIQFERFSGCFWCGVPQDICNRWEENGRGGYQRAAGGDCQYHGVLIGSLMGISYGSNHAIREHWVQRLVAQGVDGSMEGLIRYFGSKQAFDFVESNHLVAEFCWITRLLAE